MQLLQLEELLVQQLDDDLSRRYPQLWHLALPQSQWVGRAKWDQPWYLGLLPLDAGVNELAKPDTQWQSPLLLGLFAWLH